MADGSNSGWSGPTVLVDGQSLPLISIKPSASQGAPGYNAGVNASGADDIASKVTAAANQHGVDPDFALKIAHAESSLNPDATSPKGAHGVMQLMPDTAKGLGVDPHNVDQNIDGGVRYLKQLSDKYGGNKSLIAAAYNAGPGAVDQHGGVPPYPETQAYVNKVVGNQGRPTGDADWDKGEVVNNTPSVGTSVAPIRNQAAPDWEQGKPINAGVPLDNAGVVQAPQSPGYQKALAQAQQNPNALATGLANAFNPETALSQNKPEVRPFNSALNGYLFHSLPVIQGGANAIGQALNNIINKNSGVSAKEAYQAGRDASQQDLSSFGQRHPILNTAADLGGQITTSAALPEARGLGLGARLLAGAAKVGGQSALTGAGSAASEGQSPADIAKSAAVQGAIGTALSPIGEAGELGAQAFKSAGGKAAARLLLPSAIGAGVGGGTAYQLTHNPVDMAKGAVAGSALFGAPGLVKSKTAQKVLSSLIPNAEDKSAALMSLTKGVGAETPEGAATVLEQHPGKSVVEALNANHREDLMQTAGELNPNNLQHAQGVIEARQAPGTVKGRLKSAVNNSVGSNIDDISDVIAKAPHEEANNIALKSAAEKTNAEARTASERFEAEANATPQSLVENGVKGISKALDVDPRTAESDWEGVAKNNRETVSSPLWKKVETDAPVDTKVHNDLMAKEPVVRQAFADAKRVLGPEAEVENPKYVPPVPQRNISDLSQDELKALVAKGIRSGELKGTSTAELQDFYNKENSQPISNEPPTLPTQKAWIQIERNLRRMVPRNDISKTVNYSDSRTIEIEDTQRKVNAANKQHFEGLSEAKAASGEDLGSLHANETAFKFNPKSLNSESAEKFIDRYNGLGDMQQKAARYGYMERFFQKFRENPVATAKEYLNSDQHQKVMKTMFGDKAEYLNAQLGATLEAAERPKNIKAPKDTVYETPVGDTIAKAKKLISKENAAEFNHGYDNDSEYQHLYKDTYTDHLNQTINSIKSPEGNIEPKHLNEAEHLVTSDFHKEVQNKIYGKEKADQIRESIRQEIALAKHGKEVSGFEPKPQGNKEPLGTGLSGAFGGMSQIGAGPMGVLKGVVTGASVAKNYQVVEHAIHLAKQGDMTPAARQHLGQVLAQPTEQVAKDLREAAAAKRNMKASQSQIAKRVGHGAALVGANAIGPPITHALSNVNTN